jgi:hypothetical protein
MSPDPLTDVLTSVRLTGAVFFSAEGTAPWVAEGPPASTISGRVLPGADHVFEFHAVTRGHCLGGILGEAPVHLEAGDLICFPHGDPHVMSSARGLRAPPDDLSLYERPAGARLPFPPEAGHRPGRGSPERAAALRVEGHHGAHQHSRTLRGGASPHRGARTTGDPGATNPDATPFRVGRAPSRRPC